MHNTKKRSRERKENQDSPIRRGTTPDLHSPLSPQESAMPSGAKKRKAAKKKKQQQSNKSATHSHGDGDLEVHYEKESDGGEVDSPTSQDHHNLQHASHKGEEEEIGRREENLIVHSVVTKSGHTLGINGDRETTEKVVMGENGGTQIVKELKPEDYSDSKNVSIECVESVRESHVLDGGSSSSDSSSADEPHVVVENVVVEESGESKADAPNLDAGSANFVVSLKPINLHEPSQVTDDVPKMEDFNVVTGEPKEEAYDPVAANAPSVNLFKPTDLHEVTQVMHHAPIVEASSLATGTMKVPIYDCSRENAMCSIGFESGSKETGKSESSGVSPVVMDMESQKKEDKLTSTSDENSAVSSVAVGLAQKDEDKLLRLSGVPATDTSNIAEHTKDSVISDFSDRQPLVASPLRPVQTTSWKSCCGLFEVFTGSNR